MVTPRRVEHPHLPEFDWERPYTLEDVRHYTRELLTAMGYERGRGRVRPSLDEMVRAVAITVREVNRIGWSVDRQFALVVAIRLFASEYGRVAKENPRKNSH